MDIGIFLPLVAGAALLWLGGESIVAGSVAAARRFGLHPILIGVVLMGFGTSLPELVTSVEAAMEGAEALAIGNVIGSNSANILLILGLTAFLAPFAIDRDVVRRDTWFMALAAAVLALAVLRPIDAMDGMLLLLMLAIYLLVAGLAAVPAPAVAGGPGPASGARQPGPEMPAERPLWLAIATTTGGVVALILGARLFIEGAVEGARVFGVSEAVIGASVVAIGTSLPELAASVVAALRGQPALALGNVLGSNIFNVFGVLGAAAVAAPLGAEPEVISRDLPVMLGATLALVLVCLLAPRISRWMGAVFLASYAGYLYAMI